MALPASFDGAHVKECARFSAGFQVEGKLAFKSEKFCDLTVIKSETISRAYSVAVEHFKIATDREYLQIKIDGHTPKDEKGNELRYYDKLNMLELRAILPHIICIKADDDNQKWIDTLGKPYIVKDGMPQVNFTLAKLIERAKEFNPIKCTLPKLGDPVFSQCVRKFEDLAKLTRPCECVKRIFFHEKVGVITYIANEDDMRGYFAKRDGERIEHSSLDMNCEDCKMTFRPFPKADPHKFKFCVREGVFPEATFDNHKLRECVIEREANKSRGFTSYGSVVKASVVFSKCVTFDGKLTLREKESDVNLIVKKEETQSVAYGLAIEYLGRQQQSRVLWRLLINDQIPKFDQGDLLYTGSRKFSMRPEGESELKIIEQDDRSTEDTFWIDMRGKDYIASRSPIKGSR